MKLNRYGLLCLLGWALGQAGAAWAEGPVTVSEAWIRAPAPGQQVAAAYMELHSSAPSLLVRVETDVAAKAELHRTQTQGDVAQMRAVRGLPLPPGNAIRLAPGGAHVMLIDLKKTLQPGDKVPLRLIIEGADRHRTTLQVEAEVRPLTDGGPHHH